jgi:hypothetical protein
MSDDIDTLLESIRLNSVTQASAHKRRYIILKSRLKFYRLPVICLSAINSVLCIALVPFMEQGIISLINSGLALSCGIIGSIELYLQINKQMEQTLISSKDFYVLSTDIYRYLKTARDNRNVAGTIFCDDIYNRYIKLVQSSLLLKKRLDDRLTGECVLSPTGFHLVPSIDTFSDASNEESQPSDSPIGLNIRT